MACPVVAHAEIEAVVTPASTAPPRVAAAPTVDLAAVAGCILVDTVPVRVRPHLQGVGTLHRRKLLHATIIEINLVTIELFLDKTDLRIQSNTAKLLQLLQASSCAVAIACKLASSAGGAVHARYGCRGGAATLAHAYMYMPFIIVHIHSCAY